jgi:hypothetical protein
MQEKHIAMMKVLTALKEHHNQATKPVLIKASGLETDRGESLLLEMHRSRLIQHHQLPVGIQYSMKDAGLKWYASMLGEFKEVVKDDGAESSGLQGGAGESNSNPDETESMETQLPSDGRGDGSAGDDIQSGDSSDSEEGEEESNAVKSSAIKQ